MKPAAKPDSLEKKTSQPRWHFGLACLGLVIITLAVYLPVTRSGFINYDDPDYVLNNLNVHGFTWDHIKWAFTAVQSSNWHPLTWISHMLDFHFFGLNPIGHHIVNLVFHIANTFLLLFILKQATGAFWRSLVVAAFFALHPLHVESVAWIAERKDVLSTFFGLLSTLAYVQFSNLRSPNGAHTEVATVKRDAKIYFAAALLFFALSLLSKPMFVTLPFVFLLLDHWPLGKLRAQQINKPERNLQTDLRILDKVPFLAVSIACSVLTIWAQHKGGALITIQQISLSARVQNALVAYNQYFKKTFWPHDLAVFYPYSVPPLTKVFAAAALLIFISVFAIRRRDRFPYLFTGWFWFLGMLVPVIGIVQVGEQALADRYTYAPSIGLFLLLIWGLWDAFARVPRRGSLLGLIGCVALFSCATATHFQLQHWKDTQSLFEHAYAVTSRNYLAASELGVWHWSKNEPGRAKELLNEALQWRPFYSEAEKALGDISLAENKNDEAEVHYQNALKFNPTFVEGTVGLGVARLRKNDFATAEQLFRQAIQIHAGDPRTHANLGIALQQQHKNEEAIAEFHNALDLAPNLPSGYLNLATALGEQGRVDEAERVFSTGIERAAKNIELREGYAAFLNSSGKIKKAATEYRQILELKPDSVQTLNNLAWILATTSDETVRDGREAIALGQRACDLTKNKIPVVLGTLAAAYAEAGQFSNAVQKATEARMLALEQNDQAVAAKNERLITLYREGKTARDLK